MKCVAKIHKHGVNQVSPDRDSIVLGPSHTNSLSSCLGYHQSRAEFLLFHTKHGDGDKRKDVFTLS